MRRTAAKLLLLILVLILQIMFLPFFINPWPHGPMVDVSYRHKERHAAFKDYMLHPSAESKARLDVERRRMERYLAWSKAGLFVVLAVADWALIHYMLDRQHRRRIAGASPNGGPALGSGNSGVGGGPPSVS